MWALTTANWKCCTMLRSSATPFSLAAICALMSLMFCTGLRAGYFAPVSAASNSFSRKRPRSTSLKLSKSTPSCSIVVAFGDIEPGEMPPTSAWCPRDATQQGRLLPVVEDRRADRDIREMSTSVIGGVDGIDVAGPNPPLVFADDPFDGPIHLPEMHRHMG